MDKLEQKLKALEAFKDWTNYLLITTVAALGWTAEKKVDDFPTQWMKAAAVICFAISVVFAILTLALVPHVAQLMKESEQRSIYHIYWYWDRLGKLVKFRLTRLCFPQHLSFLIGILFYAVGSTFAPPQSRCVFFVLVTLILIFLFFLGLLPEAASPLNSQTGSTNSPRPSCAGETVEQESPNASPEGRHIARDVSPG